MFTDRYIKVPIKTYSETLKRVMDQPPLKDETARIDPYEICEYFPCEEDDEQAVSVHLHSGHSVIVYMSIEEFEKLLNKVDE